MRGQSISPGPLSYPLKNLSLTSLSYFRRCDQAAKKMKNMADWEKEGGGSFPSSPSEMVGRGITKRGIK